MVLGDMYDHGIGKVVVKEVVTANEQSKRYEYARNISWISEDLMWGGWHGEPDQVTSWVPLIMGDGLKTLSGEPEGWAVNLVDNIPANKLMSGDAADVSNADLTNYLLEVIPSVWEYDQDSGGGE